MSHHIKSRPFVAVLYLLISTSAIGTEQKSEKMLRRSYSSALLCALPAAEVIKVFGQKNTKGSSVAAAEFYTDSMDAFRVAIFTPALDVYGSKAKKVVMSFEQREKGFPGIVYGYFRGQATSIVKKLKLNKSAQGLYSRATPSANKICPPTLYLKSRGPGSFLLGCGWCND